MREFEVRGQIDADETNAITEALDEVRQESGETLPNEYPKSEFLDQAIDSFNELLRERLRSAGVAESADFSIPASNIHLLPFSEQVTPGAHGESFPLHGKVNIYLNPQQAEILAEFGHSQLPSSKSHAGAAIYRLAERLADKRIDREGVDPLTPDGNARFKRYEEEFLVELQQREQDRESQELAHYKKRDRAMEIDRYLARIVLHEMIHQAAFQRVSYNRQGQGKNGARTGYAWQDITEPRQKMAPLNEAVTDILTDELYEQFAEQNKLATAPIYTFFKRPKRPTFFESYYLERLLFDRITKGVAESEPDHEDYPDQVINGYFTGNMMLLRAIDRTYGPGSLRLYASLTSPDLADMEFLELVENYFTLGSDRPSLEQVQQRLASAPHQQVINGTGSDESPAT